MEQDHRTRRTLRRHDAAAFDQLADLRLQRLGAGDDLAHSSIRFGLGRFNTQEEVDYVIDKMVQVVTKLRELSPLYEMAKEGINLKDVKWAGE